MTEPSTEKRPPSAAREHPPFRMRERRRLLLPDLMPPTLDELRWAARQRRLRRETLVPQPRRASHIPPDPGEDAAVAAAPVEEELLAPIELEATAPAIEIVDAPDVIELPEVAEPVAVAEPEAVAEPVAVAGPEAVAEPPALRPWRPVLAEPVVEAAPAPVADEPADDDPPPLVSQVLVVREPAPPEPGRIAVLDEPASEVATVTRLVPLPADTAVELAPEPQEHLEEVDWDEDLAPAAVPSEVDGRPAPLYWRLLRLRYTRPNGWLRALFFEGSVAIAVVLVLAEAASVWTIVVLPFVVAVVVKANDVLAGSLRRSYRSPRRR